MQKSVQNLLLHIIGSLLFLSIPILSSPDLDKGFGMFKIVPFIFSLSSYIMLLGFFYLNYLYLIPKFYYHKQYTLMGLCVLVCFFVIVILPSVFIDRYIQQMYEHDQDISLPHEPPTFIFWPGGTFFLFALVFVFSFMLRLRQTLFNVQNEKQKAELAYLKAQINPHFLFNTLNSVYALSLEKSDATPDAIVKLSAMMRYVVTESSREFVPMQKELDYINNYIKLQKLRIDENTQLEYSINGDASGKQIAPLLLIPFIENAFKHGINPEEVSNISIKIDITENSLQLIITNDKVKAEISEDEKTGMGVANVKQRLQHLYPKKYKLHIFENDTVFDVQLTLMLT
ncbi:histidine kinase [Flavobacterium sp.]|uniref:sensor histidine kinase n=1 Tax=Flavobacterium sp. TaxID=239 RepID=UPI00260F9428|nr:histidine kinase [Flavobacterium sp.]